MTGLAKTYSQRGVRIVLAALLAVFALVATYTLAPAQKAYADTGSISLKYAASDTGNAIEGLQVNAYKIANIEGGNYVAVPNFVSMVENLGWANGTAAITSDAAWAAEQAANLDAYIRAGGPEPDATGATDAAGSLKLEGLEEGLYLVLPIGDGVHKFASNLLALDGAASLDLTVEPKVETPNVPVTDVKVVKHWSGDTGKEADRPTSVKVQLYDGSEAVGDPVTLNDANGWNYTWSNLDASVVHQWSVVELDAPADYSVSINTSESGDMFTITNTLNPTPPNNPPSDVEVTISKQEVGGGPELPGATLIVKDENGNVIEQWVSGDEPHKIRLQPGVYTLTEISAPNGYEIAETITFRVNEDGTVEVFHEGNWVKTDNLVVMFDAPTGTPPSTPVTPPTTYTPVTGKLPQTGQLWWPVPVLLAAGLVSIGAGRVVSHRSRAK